MKKFTFKLEAILKMREFHENKIKQELSEILKEIMTTETNITESKIAIKEAYEAQEVALISELSGRNLQFFPYFIKGKNEDIKNKENFLFNLKNKYKKKVEELANARAEVKIIDKFKEEKLKIWKKEKTKKENEDSDENVMMKWNRDRFEEKQGNEN